MRDNKQGGIIPADLKAKVIKAYNAYNFAKDKVIVAGHENDLVWQASVKFEDVTEKYFLENFAWVVLCSGFKYEIARKVEGKVADAFNNYMSAKDIVDHKDAYRERALAVFRNTRKIDAILAISSAIAFHGWPAFKDSIGTTPLRELRKFSMMGPALSCHLAKNLGFDVAKPDVHLLRIAYLLGYREYEGVQEMCTDIAKATGDKISVVDLTFWWYAKIEPDYVNVLTNFTTGI